MERRTRAWLLVGAGTLLVLALLAGMLLWFGYVVGDVSTIGT